MEVQIRRLQPQDSLESLTDLLHRAYASLAVQGMRFVATHQDVETTRQRTARGECYVATLEGEIVGTICFYPADRTEGCDWYDRPEVASFGQFGVEPALQRQGIGQALLDTVERRARETGAEELALDTARPATALIAYYERRGYRRVGDAQWSEVNYPSVILSKPLVRQNTVV